MTDGRFSGATHGFMIGHVAPEAADGGPIAALKNGDTIIVDIKKRRLDVELSAAEIKRRLKAVKQPKPRYTSGCDGEVRATGLVGLGRRSHRIAASRPVLPGAPDRRAARESGGAGHRDGLRPARAVARPALPSRHRRRS